MTLHDLYVDALKRWHKAMEPIGAAPNPDDKLGLGKTSGASKSKGEDIQAIDADEGTKP